MGGQGTSWQLAVASWQLNKKTVGSWELLVAYSLWVAGKHNDPQDKPVVFLSVVSCQLGEELAVVRGFN